MYEFSIWTLEEANAALPEIILLTDHAQARLDALEETWGALSLTKFDAVHGIAEEDLIRTRWALRVAALGAVPVGFFVVDFPTSTPETVLSWQHGETGVALAHTGQKTFRYCRRTTATSVARP